MAWAVVAVQAQNNTKPSTGTLTERMNEQNLNSQALNPEVLNLRDIHLPEPVSWWPLAPGWWILAGSIALIIIAFFITRKIYLSRQLKRDIKTELEHIKQRFQKTPDESELAKSLSVLLRRASISYYPAKNIAGLTGDDWLAWLDKTNTNAANKKFQSNIGKILLTAPYRADKTSLDYDAQTLINLCESWLYSSHSKAAGIV